MLVAAFFATVFSVNSETQPRGADRLRELVVFPQINLTFSWGMQLQENKWVIAHNVDLPDEITRQRNEFKRNPDDTKQLLRLAYLLNCNGETNESRTCYLKAEKLCRDKIAANPQDWLRLMALGESLDALGKADEAEHNFRKATLVSSNEWRCWVGLGNFLPNQYFFSMFPTNLLSQVGPGQMPSQAVLNYRPSAEVLGKAEAACDEASRCFEHAVAIAPKEPEVFFQQAGYMSISNWQNCFFRCYRENENISSKTWILSFFSPETTANLKKAGELKQKDYEYISLAAYFEYFVPMIQADVADFTKNMLPEKTRLSIQRAMTRLENLSEDPDPKSAAGALENLGFLNMAFGNKPAAATNFRRAVALDPTREQSWDLLLATFVEAGSPEEKVAACEAQLKQKDSARNHLLLARAFQYQKKWDKAGEQAEAALVMDSNNVVGHLELLALAIKRSADTNFMAKAFEEFDHAQAAYEKSPDNNEKQIRWRELTLNVAILYGLENTPDYQKAANAWVDAVLKNNPNDQQARDISKSLN